MQRRCGKQAMSSNAVCTHQSCLPVVCPQGQVIDAHSIAKVVVDYSSHEACVIDGIRFNCIHVINVTEQKASDRSCADVCADVDHDAFADEAMCLQEFVDGQDAVGKTV